MRPYPDSDTQALWRSAITDFMAQNGIGTNTDAQAIEQIHEASGVRLSVSELTMFIEGSDLASIIQNRKVKETAKQDNVKLNINTPKNVSISNNQPSSTLTKTTLIIIAIVALVAALAYHLHEPPPPAKSYTENQKSAILVFMEKGARMQSLTSQGVNLNSFENELASLNAAWDVLKNTNWPSSYDKERDFIEQAILGWKLVQIEWKAKNERTEASNITGISSYIEQYYLFKRYFSFYDHNFEKQLDEAKAGDDPEARIRIYMAGADRLFEMAKQNLYGTLNQ